MSTSVLTIGIGLILLLAAAAIVARPLVRWVFRRSLPQTEGSIEVDGALAPIEIKRDVDGVPHIYAATPADAHFALGFVHAQDRLWQMECQRRLAAGRLSEVFGPLSVSGDRLVRTLGLHRAAEAAWGTLPADAKAAVVAYTRGVNACLARLRGLTLPPEFVLLRVRPEPWRPVDVVACAKLLALQLNFTYAADLLRGALIEKVGADRAAALMPFADDAPRGGGSAAPADGDPRGERLDESAAVAQAAMGQEGYGSNQWVVAASRSATGSPTLACDLHLSSSAPASWYVAHLCAGPLDAIGATSPGVPAVIVGRNRHIAWGTANLSADVQDLFRERLSDDGRDVQGRSGMEPMQRTDEVIRVRGRKPVAIAARATRHGPLISDVINAARRRQPQAKRPPDSEPLALRWTALDSDDTTLAAVLALNVAKDWNGFRSALSQYVVPPLAFSYADVRGTIGLQVAGRIPVRASGDGSAPTDGWSGEAEWVGAIPFEALPAIHNPSCGTVVSANADITPDGYPHFLGRAFVEPHRHRRIIELLTATPRLRVQDHLTIQADTVSVHARELLPELLRLVTAETPQEVEALGLLQAWDHDMQTGSAAAAVFAAWWLRLPRALLEAEIGPRLYRSLEAWASFVDRSVRRTLLDARATADGEARARCARVVGDCLREALRDLERRLGPDPRAWRWGGLHRAVFAHQPFDRVPGLQRSFSRRLPTGGDWSTICVGGGWTAARPFEQRYIAAYRQVIDLSSPDGGQFIYAMGQSGHVLSPHYDDYLADWAACRARPLRVERSTVDRDTRATLTLRPRSAEGGTMHKGRRPMTETPLDPDLVEQFVTACHSDLARVTSLLAEHPSLLNARSKINESGLEGAAHVNQRPIVEFLLAQGAPLDICTAVMLGRQDTVRDMVQTMPDVSRAAGAHGIPVMTFAAIGGSLDIAELLFTKGAPLDAEPGVMTPIHMAVYMNRADIVDWLIAHGAKVDATYSGMTPVQFAEKQKREQVLEVFRRHATPESAV